MEQLIERSGKSALETAVNIWKKLDIGHCRMEFSCGGDSMNDYSFAFHSKSKDKEIKKEKVHELDNFFDDEVFKRVEFYVNSCDNYIGEFGTVTITLNEDGDDFEYDKSSQSEYSETFTESTTFPVDDAEASFINEFVLNFNGSDSGIIFNFKKDLILSKERNELIDSLGDRLKDFCYDYEMKETEEIEGESGGFTVESEDTVKVEGDNLLKIDIHKQYTIFKEEGYY